MMAHGLLFLSTNSSLYKQLIQQKCFQEILRFRQCVWFQKMFIGSVYFIKTFSLFIFYDIYSFQINNKMENASRYGSWGICFTYGTWFGIKGLIAAGKSYQDSLSIRKACEFLLSKQQLSGGWGESYISCQHKVT